MSPARHPTDRSKTRQTVLPFIVQRRPRRSPVKCLTHRRPLVNALPACAPSCDEAVFPPVGLDACLPELRVDDSCWDIICAAARAKSGDCLPGEYLLTCCAIVSDPYIVHAAGRNRIIHLLTVFDL